MLIDCVRSMSFHCIENVESLFDEHNFKSQSIIWHDYISASFLLNASTSSQEKSVLLNLINRRKFVSFIIMR